jgi:hypothetical protein
MTNDDRDSLRAIAAAIFKLANEMNVNIEPTRSQCKQLRGLGARLLTIINEE